MFVFSILLVQFVTYELKGPDSESLDPELSASLRWTSTTLSMASMRIYQTVLLLDGWFCRRDPAAALQMLRQNAHGITRRLPAYTASRTALAEERQPKS